jgi:hypothetical protein
MTTFAAIDYAAMIDGLVGQFEGAINDVGLPIVGMIVAFALIFGWLHRVIKSASDEADRRGY